MPQQKICKALVKTEDAIQEDGSAITVQSFSPVSPEMIDSKGIAIHPDENGEQWYWTPDDSEESTNA